MTDDYNKLKSNNGQEQYIVYLVGRSNTVFVCKSN